MRVVTVLLSVLLLCLSIHGVRGKCTAPSFFGTEEEAVLNNLKAQGGTRARNVLELCHAVMNLAGQKRVVDHFKKYHEGVVENGEGCSVCHWENGRLPYEAESHDRGARLIENFRAVLAHLSEDNVFNDKYPEFKLSESAPTCLGTAKKLLTCFNSIFPYENLPHDTETGDYTLFDVSIYKPFTGMLSLAPAADGFCANLAERMEEGKCDAAKTAMGDKLRLQPFKEDDENGVTLMCAKSRKPIKLNAFVTKMKETVAEYQKQPKFKESIKRFWGSQPRVDWYDVQSNEAYKSYYGQKRGALRTECESMLRGCADDSSYLSFVEGLCDAMFEHTIPFWIYQLDFAEAYNGKTVLSYDATLSEEQLLKLIYKRLHQMLTFSVLEATEPVVEDTTSATTGKKEKKDKDVEEVETAEDVASEEDPALSGSEATDTANKPLKKGTTGKTPKPIAAATKSKKAASSTSEEEEEDVVDEEASTMPPTHPPLVDTKRKKKSDKAMEEEEDVVQEEEEASTMPPTHPPLVDTKRKKKSGKAKEEEEEEDVEQEAD